MAQLSKADALLMETNPEAYFIKTQIPLVAANWKCGPREATGHLLTEWRGILKVRLEVNRSQDKIAEAERYIKIIEDLISTY